MDITIDEAAALMGKTARQVRYMITKGRLPARKDGKSWKLRRKDLPVPDGATQNKQNKQDALRDAAEKALDPPDRKAASLSDVKAVQVARPLLGRLSRTLGADHPATRAVRACLGQLGRGYYRYHPDDKTTAYAEARDLASSAVVALMLDENNDASALAEHVERELMPAIAGLLRRLDRQSRRRNWRP